MPTDISGPGSDAWVKFNYDLTPYMATMNGGPIYNEDPATWTWTWSSWVPAFLQLEQNKGRYFYYDDAFYNTLSAADQITYINLLWGDWTYYEGSPFGTYDKPIVGYNVAGAPYKLRLVVHDGGGAGVRFQAKNIALKGATNTYVSEWKTMQPDYWTATAGGQLPCGQALGLAEMGPDRPGRRRRCQPDVVHGLRRPRCNGHARPRAQGSREHLRLGVDQARVRLRVLARGLRHRQGRVLHRRREQLADALRL